MNRLELVSEIASKANVSKKDAESALSAIIETIQSTVANGEKVSLTGFGTWEARKRAAREGRNPSTGEKISISAKTVPAFSAGKTFKTIVSEG